MTSFHQVHVVIELGHVRRVIVWQDPEGHMQVAIRRVVSGQPGICQRCGCSELDACPGRCYWLDFQRTLCSRCGVEVVAQLAYMKLLRRWRDGARRGH